MLMLSLALLHVALRLIRQKPTLALKFAVLK
jgi:hypothetical protein